MTTKYDNIPVSKEKQTYLKVQMIAEAKGFGKRGVGALIEHWADREFAAPVCDHPKTLVQVQRSPSETVLTEWRDGQKQLFYQAYYCATCNCVYQQLSTPDEGFVSAEEQKQKTRKN